MNTFVVDRPPAMDAQPLERGCPVVVHSGTTTLHGTYLRPHTYGGAAVLIYGCLIWPYEWHQLERA